MRLIQPRWSENRVPSLFEDFDSWMSEFTPSPTQNIFTPFFDFTEESGYFLMSVDLPGFSKNDIHINIDDRTLTLSGERKQEWKTDDKRFLRQGRFYRKFKQSYTLPDSVNADAVEAKFENGVLELYLPKLTAAVPKRIEIQDGKSGFFERILGSRKSLDDKRDTKADNAS